MRVCFPRRKALAGAAIAILFLLSAPSLVPGADAQEAGRRVTVIEAVRTALADNHELRALRSARDAQEKDIGIARSHLLPKVYVEERYLRTTNPGWAFMSKLGQERIEQGDFNPDLLNHPDAINDYQSSVTVEMPLFVKKALVGLDMSRVETRAKEMELGRKREEVAFRVVRACLTIESARQHVRAVEEGVADALEHHRVAELRYQNGVGQYADTLRTSTALTEARQRTNVAGKNLSLARRGLGLLMATTDPVDVDGDGDALILKDLPHYVKSAEARSDLRAAELREENARHGIRLAEAGYFPYVGVGGTYQLNDHSQPFGSEGQSWQVTAFLRWDLFDGTRREYERAKARHLSTQAREFVSLLKKAVSFRIFEAWLNVEEARKNTELAREALKTAEEGTRLLTVRYENGLSPLADLLGAQSSLEQARAGVVERENAYQTAVAALSFESGTILRDLNLEQ